MLLMLVYCGYGISRLDCRTVAALKLPLLIFPKNGLGTSALSCDPSERYCGFAASTPILLQICSPRLPRYEASTSRLRNTVRCKLAFHCWLNGVSHVGNTAPMPLPIKVLG